MKKSLLVLPVLAVILVGVVVIGFSGKDTPKEAQKIDDSVSLNVRFAVWTGKEIIVGAVLFVEEEDAHEFRIYRISGDKKEVALRIPIGDRPIPGDTAVWTGKEILIFGGTENEGTAYQTPDVYSYSPDTNQLRLLNASIPYPNSGKAALWDGRYGYLFIQPDRSEEKFVYRFEPETGRFEKLNVTYPEGFGNPGTCLYSAVWYKGLGYLVFRDKIAVFDPSSLSFRWSNATLPTEYYARSAVVTEEGIFIFGGFLTWDDFSREIFKFVPEKGLVEKMKSELPFGVAQAPAVWNGRWVYIIGGYSNGRDVNAIIPYDYRADRVGG